MNTAIITVDYNSIPVFFQSNAFINATAVAKHFNKLPKDYLKSESTKSYIEAIRRKILIQENQLVNVLSGSPENGGGTWLHPKLAIDFARWLSADFAVWCDEQIEKILHPQPPAQTPATLSRMQLIQMAMESELANQALQVQVETQQQEIAALEPQAEALKRIAVFAEGTYCIRDSAKLLQVEEKFLKAWLSEHDWIYRRPTGGGWLGYSDKLKKGYLEHKLTTGDKTDGSGTQWSSNQVRITSKGLAKLSLLLNQGAQA